MSEIEKLIEEKLRLEQKIEIIKKKIRDLQIKKLSK
jgi:hypothetical protein